MSDTLLLLLPSVLLNTILVLGLLCPQTLLGTSDCLSTKDKKTLDNKSAPVERHLVLAEIGEREVSRLLHVPSGTIWNEQPAYAEQQNPNQILDVHDCAWSELLQELFEWKPRKQHDRKSIRDLLRRVRGDEKPLNELLNASVGRSRIQKSLNIICELEKRLVILSK